MSENLELWDRVRTPNPKFTKEFNRGGGFKGTATNTQYVVQRATEEFGPNGIGWGLEITGENFVSGATLKNGDKAIIHIVRGRIWYMADGEKRFTSEQFGQTTFVGENKHGSFTDEEAPKKSVTDCMLKCFSLLGFNADIFLGLWDDQKYVSGVRQEFQKTAIEQCTTEQVEEIERELKETGSDISKFLEYLGVEGLHLLNTDTYQKAKAAIAHKREQMRKQQ